MNRDPTPTTSREGHHNADQAAAGRSGHDFLHGLYDSLHDSPIQRRFRALCPMPFGVVFLPWEGMTEEDARRHFRMMKELGFTNLKQTMPTPQWPQERILELALEEGIIPFWYGEGGWEAPSPDLLARLGIPQGLPLAELCAHPAMRAYQDGIIRKRIAYPAITEETVEGTILQDAGFVPWNRAGLRLHNDPELRPDAVPAFKAWVKKEYKTIEVLRKAWNQDEVGITMEPYTSWEDFEADADLSRHNRREYRFIRDVLRFKADVTLDRIRRRMELVRDRDPGEPQRAGGEMGLFLPFAWRGTDMEGIAKTMTEFGSFYPSIHMAWHFEETHFELARGVYMQASIAADWFKGGWSATWESTGGPQQFSGGKGWTHEAALDFPGVTVNGGTMVQLLLSYLAAGFKGVGLWCWNFRRAGWEAGEYALLDRQGRPSDRAVQAGRIAKAANRYREELWAAHKEPTVGVYVDYDNEAYWAAISVPNRDMFKHFPVHARIGVSRALMNANVPFEHLTARDLRSGLAPRYQAIYLPAHVSLPPDVLEAFLAYVRQGGRLVLDAPGAWFDDCGRVLDTGAGSTFESIFGVELRDFQYARNVPRRLHGTELPGFTMELAPTTARALERFDTGEAAVTEKRHAPAGSAVILAWEASRSVFGPDRPDLEALLLRYTLGTIAAPYACDGALVYRLAAPQADHYFFVNDGDARSVHLSTGSFSYARAEDPITGEALPLGGPIALSAHSGRWVRMEKA